MNIVEGLRKNIHTHWLAHLHRYIHIHTYTFTCIQVYIHIHIQRYTYTHTVYIFSCKHIHTYLHTCTYIHTNTYIYIFFFLCFYILLNTHMYVFTQLLHYRQKQRKFGFSVEFYWFKFRVFLLLDWFSFQGKRTHSALHICINIFGLIWFVCLMAYKP